MIHVKALSTKEDLFSAIQETWNDFDKEYCFKLAESMSARINAVIKTWGGTIKYQV